MKLLTVKQIALLVELLSKSNLNKKKLMEIKSKNGICSNKEIVAEVLNILTEALCKYGLNPDDEPNSLGLEIEDLITFYSNISMELNK